MLVVCFSRKIYVILSIVVISVFCKKTDSTGPNDVHPTKIENNVLKDGIANCSYCDTIAYRGGTESAEWSYH